MFYFKKNVFLIISTLFFVYFCIPIKAHSQNPPMKLAKTSKDKKYGLSEKNPIKVGTVRNEYIYLKALIDAKGKEIKIEREGSCCGFETNSPHAILGSGMLDIWTITYIKDNKKVTLYLNGYDFEEPKAPAGFKFKKEKK